MCKFKIKFEKEIAPASSLFKKSEYSANSDGFESIVTVSVFNKTQPYVSYIDCTKGESKLNHYAFWHEIQVKVLEFHNSLKEKENENENQNI